MTDEMRRTTEELATRRLALIDGLKETGEGLAWCHRHTDLVDTVVRSLTADFPDRPPIAVVATGGYGRRELAPYSDLDLAIVPADETDPETDAIVRVLFRRLHAAITAIFRMEIGYSYRLVGDAPGLDAKSRTGLIDARLVVGDPVLLERLRAALDATLEPGEFVLNKLAEREAAWQRTNDTPLSAEPHLKEGAGGLRCHHAANWIRHAMGETPRRATESYDLVLAARNALQAVTGKDVDHLTGARRPEVVRLLGGADLAAAATDVHDEFVRQRSRLLSTRYRLGPGVEALNGEVRVSSRADLAEAAVGVAHATRLGLEIPDIPVGTRGTEDGGPALYALASGEATVRNLDRAGLLDALLPELTACRTLFPDEPSHAYSVFEHTLRVLRNADAPPDGFLEELKLNVRDRESLALAILLHDVGKIDPSADHSELGAEMVRTVGSRLRLPGEIVETASWLVRNHLVMSRFIRMRDVRHPPTVAEFAALVGSEDRLVLLANLTWADIAAVNPHAWTAAQEIFLRELYEGTRALLQGRAADPDPDRARKRLVRQLRGAAEESKVQAFADAVPAHYLTSTDPEWMSRHRAWAEIAPEGAVIDIRPDASKDASDVTIVAVDRPGLLADILGAVYAFDLSVLSIRAATANLPVPIAIDSLLVAFSGRVVPSSTADHFRASLGAVLRGELDVEALLRERGKDPARRQEVTRITVRDGDPAAVEVRAPRGRGMPFRVARAISEEGFDIVSARIGQWAGRGAATFYLRGSKGTEDLERRIERALGAER